LKSTDGSKELYLALSSRLFDYGSIRAGDEIVLGGKQNPFGVYVDSFRLMPSHALATPNFGLQRTLKPAAESAR
jgi:hypothetical protein